MADIAMLVAEEHEKRMKRGAPRAVAGADEEASGGRVNFGAVAKVWGSWAESAAAAASGVRVHVAVLVRSDLAAAEPRSPVARAAFDGFFSA